jgi:hypothetical protein
MAHMEIPNFIVDLVNVGIEAGIVTKTQEEKSIWVLRQKIDELKRRSGCYIPGKEAFKERMPFYAQMMEDDWSPSAEVARYALREVGTCGIESLFTELIAEQKEA